jgi:HD-GYP domain-containing protein (c-di-GMP phosphodiesterase class II)
VRGRAHRRLLHDIGKQALPDHLLLGRSELHPDERR